MDTQWARLQKTLESARDLERERTKELVEEITGWMEDCELELKARERGIAKREASTAECRLRIKELKETRAVLRPTA